MEKIKLWFQRHYMILITALLLSVLSHSIVLWKMFTKGTLFTGKGDGIAQMLPFQMYLYEKFTTFQMNYAMDFGLGGDYSRDLAYYYATSPITYLNYLLVWIGDIFLPYDTSDIVFWAKNQIFISIIKLFLILIVTYALARQFKMRKITAMTVSYLYSFSSVYYFFTFTWSFFSDVMLWLPLTIYGIERLFRHRKVTWFVIAIALTLFSNFYFSYYEFVFIFVYFVYRVMYPAQEDILNRWQKVWITSISAIIGLCIAMIGFMRGVTGFMNNDRTLPELNIKPIIDIVVHYNIFYDGYYVVVPFMIILALMSFKLYSHYDFRLFATLSLLFMVGSLSPLFDSFFNGFSVDQRRWVYLFALVVSMTIGLYIEHIKEVDKKTFLVSLIPVVVIFPLSVIGHDKFLYWLLFIPVIVVLLYIGRIKDSRWIYVATCVLIMMMNFVMVHEYVKYQLDSLHPEKERNIDYINSSQYDSDVQRDMIDTLQQKNGKIDRIDWQTSATHNTPMIQDFNGVKLYSSIFDKDIYQFYDEDLNVTMETDSNSIYYRLGERANLYSLFNVNSAIRVGESMTIPYGFEILDTATDEDNTNYVSYINKNKLPFVRVVDKTYDIDKLQLPIEREHAMLNGVVLPGGKDTVKPAENLLKYVKEIPVDATYTNGILNVTTENKGMQYQLPKKIARQYKDLYLDVSIELKSPNKAHYVWFNEIYQARKELDNDYRRFNDRVTIKIKSDDIIDLKLMTGEYTYKLNGIYGEDYKTLQKSSEKYQKQHHKFKIKRNGFDIQLDKHDEGHVVLPIPFLKGMTVYVDGQKADIYEGNYLMTAIPVKKDAEHVVIKYRQPYLLLSMFITAIGIIALYFFRKRMHKKRHL